MLRCGARGMEGARWAYRVSRLTVGWEGSCGGCGIQGVTPVRWERAMVGDWVRPFDGRGAVVGMVVRGVAPMRWEGAMVEH